MLFLNPKSIYTQFNSSSSYKNTKIAKYYTEMQADEEKWLFNKRNSTIETKCIGKALFRKYKNSEKKKYKICKEFHKINIFLNNDNY